MSIQNRDGVLYMRFQYRGKCIYRSTDIDAAIGTREEARNRKAAQQKEVLERQKLKQEFAKRELAGISEEEYDELKLKRQEPMPTLIEFADKWWKERGNSQYPECRKDGRPNRTRAWVMDRWSSLLRAYDDNGMPFTLAMRKLNKIDRSAIEQFQRIRTAMGLSGLTIRADIKGLMMFLKAAKFWNIIPDVPNLHGLPEPPAARKRMRVLSFDEEPVYLAAADENLRLLVQICIDTVLEPGYPSASIDWKDVYLPINGTVFIPVTGEPFEYGCIYGRCQKGPERERFVGLSKRLSIAMMKRWYACGEPTEGCLFPAARNGGGHSAPFSTFQSAHKRLWGASVTKDGPQQHPETESGVYPPLVDPETRLPKIPYFRLYDIRHTAVTRMEASGASSVAIKQAAGWSSTRMLDNYAHPNEGRKAETYSDLNKYIEKKKRKEMAS